MEWSMLWAKIKKLATRTETLEDKVNRLLSIGRFLSTWDCTTGLPVSNPPANPYTYQTGDYYRISAVGGTNYKPNGTTYTGVASTTVDTDNVEVRGIYIYDGTGNWLYLPNQYADHIVDVQVNGTSVVSEQGIANIPINHETWTFTLEDNTTVNKEVALWISQQ